MLLHNLGRDGETETGAALLGGIERQKQPLADFIGEAVAGYRRPRTSTDAPSSLSELRSPSTRQQTACMASAAVVDEVRQGAANGFRISQHGRQTRLQIELAR